MKRQRRFKVPHTKIVDALRDDHFQHLRANDNGIPDVKWEPVSNGCEGEDDLVEFRYEMDDDGISDEDVVTITRTEYLAKAEEVLREKKELGAGSMSIELDNELNATLTFKSQDSRPPRSKRK